MVAIHYVDLVQVVVKIEESDSTLCYVNIISFIVTITITFIGSKTLKEIA